MPAEDNYQQRTAAHSPVYASSQPKPCPSCRALILVPETEDADDIATTCPNCCVHFFREGQPQNNTRRLIDQDIDVFELDRAPSPDVLDMRRPFDAAALVSPPASPVPPSLPDTLQIPSPPYKSPVLCSAPAIISVYRIPEDPPAAPTIKTDVTPAFSHPITPSLYQPHFNDIEEQPHDIEISNKRPDPLADITRLRMRTRSHYCLYPGATFHGTQKSGRNSYDVSVTIVDVDFATSFLCGYLCIRGLTEDWPELTTFFDAEIIGSRHGFLTQNWGASENEDLVHWSRFPAFRHIKQEAKRPRLTIDDRDRGAVFMRWKERFLVPDHQVQDITGASFAGFYYVCVDFSPATATGTTACQLDGEEGCIEQDEQRSGRKQHRTRRGSSARSTTIQRTPSITPYSPPVATMSGFYYHQNSEPYQQLSLVHVPETSTSSFEFR